MQIRADKLPLQLKVLKLWNCDKYIYKAEIARQLGLSKQTVADHLKSMKRLGFYVLVKS